MSLSRFEQRRLAYEQSLYATKKPTNLVAPITFGNGTTKENYTSPTWNVRAGADDHLDCASFSLGAQIEIVSKKQKPQSAKTA